MRTAFIESLCELAGLDERVWLLTADLGYSVLERFATRFPDRFLNVGVAEQNMIGVAAGLARCGKIPFTYSIANFPTFRCLEQIRNDVCYHGGSVKIVAVGGGFAYGPQGYTHHGLEDLAIMRCLPGMTVVAPGDPAEASLATQALARHPGPGYLRLGKANEPTVHKTVPNFQLGRSITIRSGRDVTLISTGAMLTTAVESAQRLAIRGIDARVISMHTLKPLDRAAIESAALETAGIVTVEEHSVTGGLGSAVAEVLAESPQGHCPLHRCGVADRIDHTLGSQSYLRRSLGDLDAIVERLIGRNFPVTRAS